jgi:hypothetical protein
MPRRRAVAEPMRICFHKTEGTRYRSTIHRPDGAVIALEGGSWNRIGGPVARVPHDLTHLVVEQELGLERGLWGVLAAGGRVQNAVYAIAAGLRDAALEWDRLAPGSALVRTWRGGERRIAAS